MRFVRGTAPPSTTAKPSSEADFACLFSGVLWQVRWVVLAGLLLLSFAQPLVGRAGLPTWALVVIFVVYNLTLELLRRTTRVLQAPAMPPLIDLPLIAALYAASAAPGEPVYVLVLLVVTCAAATLSLRASLIYTSVATALMAAIAPTLPFWLATTWQTRERRVAYSAASERRPAPAGAGGGESARQRPRACSLEGVEREQPAKSGPLGVLANIPSPWWS